MFETMEAKSSYFQHRPSHPKAVHGSVPTATVQGVVAPQLQHRAASCWGAQVSLNVEVMDGDMGVA